MKILLIAGNLHQGGAQKSAILLACAFQNASYEIELIVLDSQQNDFFVVPPSIKTVRVELSFPTNLENHSFLPPLNIIKSTLMAATDLLSIKRSISNSNADLYIALESHVGVLVGLVTSYKKPLIISERVHPQFHPVVKPLSYFQKIVYRRKNIFLHAQGPVISDWLSRRYGKDVKTIPNFVPRPSTDLTKPRSQTVICVGRYAWQKGTDLLIEAWSRIPQDLRRDWSLLFFGSGEIEPYVKLIDSLNVGDSIKLNSEVSNVESIYETAGIFVSASRYEGFPNALAEAMAHGLPSLTTDNPSAVRELTMQGKLALLVNVDIDSIALGLAKLISDKESRDYFSQAGVEVLETFGESQVLGLWKGFIESITKAFPNI